MEKFWTWVALFATILMLIGVVQGRSLPLLTQFFVLVGSLCFLVGSLTNRSSK